MTFQEFIQHIETRINDSISSETWTATLKSISERRPKAIKVEIEFSKDGFSFTRDIKLHESHFTTANAFVNEIERQLNRLERYSNAVTLWSTIEALPNITNNWKASIRAISVLSPIHAVLTVSFFRNFSGEPIFINKDITVQADSFISRQVYADWLESQLVILNTSINISYYESLIKTI